MKIPTVLLGLLLSTLAADARSGPQVTTQTRAVPAFTHLDLRAPIRTDVHEGRPARVTVLIDDSLQKDLVTRVSGDTLIVELDTRGHTEISDGARVSIDVPSLSEIALEGPGDAYVDATGAHPQIDFKLTGPGDLHWNGDADVVRCRIDGPGGAVLHGSGKRVDVRVDGPGSLDARAFPIMAGAFELGGPGHAIVDLHGGDVSVVVNGPGSFHYTGDAHFTRREVNGPGNIRKL
jgi:Putative auto-transporter adhesin, head GIN domain